MNRSNPEYYVKLGYEEGNAAEMALAYAQGEGMDKENVRMDNIIDWLFDYKGSFEFYISLKNQWIAKGFLSEKQKEAVERAIARDAERASPKQEVKTVNYRSEECLAPTYKEGTTLKISRGVAKAIAEEKGMQLPFRKVEVLKTHRETTKAVLVTVKYSAQIGHFCGICGRGLTHPVSQATGIGPECASKLNITRYSMSDAKSILSEIESRLNAMGEVQVWLPRSKIERV
jgi:uncharacterized ferredoxin-like protein